MSSFALASMLRPGRCALALAASACGAAAPAAEAAMPPRVADQLAHVVVVGIRHGSAPRVIRAARATDVRRLGREDRLRLRVRGDAGAAVARLRRDPGVRFAERVRATRSSAATAASSSAYSQQWGLSNDGSLPGSVAQGDVDASGAWAIAGSGASSVLVASVDTGVAFSLPSLAALNLWTNPGESGSGAQASTDDDDDFCADDVHGCNFVAADDDPTDDEGHGTATTTVMLGPWGSSPVAGIAPASQLITAKALDSTGAGTTAEEAAAFNYVAEQGARVVNASLAGPASRAVEDAIEQHPQTLFVVAAGNAASDDDTTPVYPCASPATNVICVAASTDADGLASFSNTGTTAVDLAAPGQAIPSLNLDGDVDLWSGTSFAAPMVSGAAALAFAAAPAASPAQVKAAILAGVETRPAFAGTTATGGRLDAARMLQGLLGEPLTARAPLPAPAAPAPATPDPAATPTPVRPPASAAPSPVTKPAAPAYSGGVRMVALRRRGATRAGARVTCASTHACTGTIVASPSTARPAPFSLGPGATKTVFLAVSRRARRVTLRIRTTGRATQTLTRSLGAGASRRRAER